MPDKAVPKQSNKTTQKLAFVEKKVDLITNMLAEGKFEYHVYKALGISKPTWIKFKLRSKKIQDAIDKGREKAMEELIPKLHNAILQNALGYTDPEAEKITIKEIDDKGKRKVTERIVSKTYPPDTKAAHIMLKNLTKNAPKDEDKWLDDPASFELKKEKLDYEKELAKMKIEGF